MAQNGFHEVIIEKWKWPSSCKISRFIQNVLNRLLFHRTVRCLPWLEESPEPWEKSNLGVGTSSYYFLIPYIISFVVSWSPDDKSVAFGASDNAVRVINTSNGMPEVFMAGHNDWVQAIFSANGKAVSR